ncbi:DUF6228 family protein [Streptomyces sp. NPDC000351]|uniref:DUF6228 family protein n=1 Tax=Streptomyces sp. NPDC000351 TaxID=3154250 RepID=UPI00331674BB
MTYLDGTEDSGVTLRCLDNRAVGIRFSDRSLVDADCAHYAVELWAPGLKSRVDGVVVWALDADLASFLDRLVADFRGWDGARTWHTVDEDLALLAVFRSGGRVGLAWTLRPWRTFHGSWNASATIWLEAGEQLAAAAADIRHFLEGNPS